MATPKLKHKKKKQNSMAVAVHGEKGLQWGGVMPKVGNNETDNAKLTVFVNQVAKVYGVPSLGVNAMGGNPYLNKDGRIYLLNDLRQGKQRVKAIRKEFLQMSRSADEASIVKVTLVFFDGHEVEAIGEASKASVKLEAVKNTLNMMAETRGLNRAIWQEIGGDVWKRVERNITRQKLSDEEKARVIQAGTVSFEEVNQPNRNAAKPVASPASDLVAMALQSIAKLKDPAKIEKLRLDAQGSDKINVVQKKQVFEAAKARLEELGAEKN